MSEFGGDNQMQKIGTAVSVLAALLVLRRLRKRRKEKKLVKERAKAKVRAAEKRVKEEKARGKAGKADKGDKKSKKERSILEQLVRFTILAAAKKFISKQIEMAGKDLGGSKLGKKVVEVSKTRSNPALP